MMMLNISYFIAIYRVSTQKQIEDESSIDNQRATGKSVAEKLRMKYHEMNEGGKISQTFHKATGKIMPYSYAISSFYDNYFILSQ